MITGLDHVVVLTGDINAARAAYQTLLARAPAWQNSGDGADRVLFTLDNMTLELMAPSGVDDTAHRIRTLLDDQGEGYSPASASRRGDMGKMHRRLDRVTLKPDAVADVESRDAARDTPSLKRTRTATELTRGVRMFFLELARERPLSVRPTSRRSTRSTMS